LFKAKGLVRAKIGEANGFEDSSVTSLVFSRVQQNYGASKKWRQYLIYEITWCSIDQAVLLVCYWLAAFSRGIFIFTQTLGNMPPRGLHFYLGIS
jgi:hypothetical protein